MLCPNDQSNLHYDDHVYSCGVCHGSFHKREGLGDSIYENLGEMFRQRLVQDQKVCPHCQSEMLEIEHREGDLYLDICPNCHGIWFDAGEIPHLKHYIKRRLDRKQRYLSEKAQKQESKVQQLYHRYLAHSERHEGPSVKEALFQIISSLPLERNLRPIQTPYVVFSLIAINLIVFAISMETGLERFLLDWAFIPGQSDIFPKILNSLFLHGGITHILGNMYFLWIMGDNVEDLMGKRNFLAIYFLAGILGFVVSGWEGRQGIPHVGASGAVAGIMASYFLLFPKAKFLLRFFFVIVIPISSFFYILFWLGWNVFSFTILQQPGVAWSAHITGFLVGLVITYLFKQRHGIPAKLQSIR